MERLSDTAIEIINDLHTERLEYASEYIPLIDAANRLAAYEDTGLEPEEIKVHEAVKYNAGYYHGDEDRCRWIEKELGPIDHLRDLLQAEQDGRLVVLPCGTDVELVRDGYAFKADHWNHTLTAFRDEPKNKSGKQIALFSTKEAEAAMAQEEAQ